MRINETNIDGGRNSLARANVREKFTLDNPENANILVRFGYIDAGNNWWWAIDNVSVEAQVPANRPAKPNGPSTRRWRYPRSKTRLVLPLMRIS